MKFLLPIGNGSRWDNNELRYLLRSLEAHFLDEVDMTIYGDTGYVIDWLTNVDYKTIDRYYPEKLLRIYKGRRHYEEYISVLDKVYRFVNSPDCPEEFVYIYDDVLLLDDIDRSGILNVPECEFTPKMFLSYRRDKHRQTMNQSFVLSLGKYRFEHHLPLIYNRDNLKEMFIKYPFQEMKVPYSLATLYFNNYNEYVLPALDENNNYKAGFEGFYEGKIACFKQDTIDDIESAVAGKTWANYCDTGLFWMPPTYPLQEWIKSKFDIKSNFEK